MNQTILMCPPTYFEVAYKINPWMDANVGYKKSQLAQEQWEALHAALSKVADVKLVDPVQGLPDMVFTANAGLFIDGNVYLSNFKHDERKPETAHFRKWFSDNGYTLIDRTDIEFEGQGDCLVDAFGRYWLGYGFRSDEQYYWALYEHYVNVHKLRLVDSRFYHIDTCFCPLTDGSLMYYPGAFDEESCRKIEDNFAKNKIIRVTEQEAVTFCCNAVNIHNQVFMPECKSVARRLELIGYTVHQFNLSEYQKSGGAAKCLVMHL